MPLLINLLPFPILIWCRVRQIVLEPHNLASAANCHTVFLNAVSNASLANSHSTGMSLSSPAEPWPCPIKPGLLLRHSCRYPCTQIPKITAVWLRQHLYFPPPAQPPTSIQILTLYCNRLVDQDQTAPRSRALVLLSAPLRARSLPPGPPFSSANLDRFFRSRTCTSHDTTASTRREPSTCSPSHQGPADRTLKAGKMLLSLAGRTPRLGKRRPWSRNQAGKGGVGLRYHTPGEARGPNLLYYTVSWTAVHANGSHIVCMQRCNAEVAPSTSFPFGCGLLLLATSYGRAAENNSLRRGTAPGRDFLDRPTSMLTKHKS